MDNQAAIRLSKNPEYHARSKHIALRYYFLRETVLSRDISPQFTPTADNVADVLTKPLPRPTFERLLKLGGGRTLKDEWLVKGGVLRFTNHVTTWPRNLTEGCRIANILRGITSLLCILDLFHSFIWIQSMFPSYTLPRFNRNTTISSTDYLIGYCLRHFSRWPVQLKSKLRVYGRSQPDFWLPKRHFDI